MDHVQMAANTNAKISAISEAVLEAADVQSTLKDWEPGGGFAVMQSPGLPEKETVAVPLHELPSQALIEKLLAEQTEDLAIKPLKALPQVSKATVKPPAFDPQFVSE